MYDKLPNDLASEFVHAGGVRTLLDPGSEEWKRTDWDEKARLWRKVLKHVAVHDLVRELEVILDGNGYPHGEVHSSIFHVFISMLREFVLDGDGS